MKMFFQFNIYLEKVLSLLFIKCGLYQHLVSSSNAHLLSHVGERTCVHHRLIISIWWQVETRMPYRTTCSRIYYQLYVTTTTNLTKLLPNSILLNSLSELRAKLQKLANIHTKCPVKIFIFQQLTNLYLLSYMIFFHQFVWILLIITSA